MIMLKNSLRRLRQFEILKSQQLNYYQDYSLNFIKKPNINNEEDIDRVRLMLNDSEKNKDIDKNYRDSHFDKMLYYFNQKQKENCLSDIDLKIMDNLVEPIKSHLILNKSNNQ